MPFPYSLRFGSTYLNFHRHTWSNVSTFKIKYNAENARKTECYNTALESEKGQSIFFLTNVSNVWLKVFFFEFFFRGRKFFQLQMMTTTKTTTAKSSVTENCCCKILQKCVLLPAKWKESALSIRFWWL